jgi:hypothetical protein
LKITPANQSLILAGESPLLGAGSRLVAAGSVLPRVSVAVRTDAVAIVQTEYLESRPPRALAQDLPMSGSARRPLQLYARTQRGFEDSRDTALLDVFA